MQVVRYRMLNREARDAGYWLAGGDGDALGPDGWTCHVPAIGPCPTFPQTVRRLASVLVASPLPLPGHWLALRRRALPRAVDRPRIKTKNKKISILGWKKRFLSNAYGHG